jgi:hypothetical protein
LFNNLVNHAQKVANQWLFVFLARRSPYILQKGEKEDNKNMKFEYSSTPFKSQLSWVGFTLVFWLIIWLATMAIDYGVQNQDSALLYMGYLAIGSIVFLLVLSIVETLLWKLGRLKETYSWGY